LAGVLSKKGKSLAAVYAAEFQREFGVTKSAGGVSVAEFLLPLCERAATVEYAGKVMEKALRPAQKAMRKDTRRMLRMLQAVYADNQPRQYSRLRDLRINGNSYPSGVHN
jgi:hypothetical protein